MLKAVGRSTNRTYASAWGQWTMYRRIRKEDPFLREGRGSAEDEDAFLNLLVYCHSALGQT